MRNPGFQRMAKLPDKEFRTLAATKNADKIMDRFVSEAAKDMKTQKVRETRNKKLEKIRNAPKKDPKAVNV